MQGECHENRHHRRNRPYRFQDGRNACAGRAMKSLPPLRTPASTRSPVRAWPRRSSAADVVDRPRKLALFRGQGGAGILRNLGPQSAGGRKGRRRQTPYRALRGRHRTTAGERLSSAAKLAQEKLIKASRRSLHDRSFDAVHGVPGRHRPIRHDRRYSSPVTGLCPADRL